MSCINHRTGIGAATTIIGTVAFLAFSSPVLAHIDPDPTEAQAGSRLSVGFTVEHGCDGSPTTSLDMRLPDGVIDADPEPPAGWEGSVSDNVVTFVGGPLPDDQELTFNVALTLPATPDISVYFPFVQRCEVGEIRWIDVPSDGSGDDLDEPAPAMALTGPVATPTIPAATTTLVPATTAPTTATTPSTTSTAPSTTPSAEPVAPAPADIEPSDTAPVDTSPSDTAVADTAATSVVPDPDPGDGDGDGGGALVAIGAGVIAVIAVAGGALYFRRRPS